MTEHVDIVGESSLGSTIRLPYSGVNIVPRLTLRSCFRLFSSGACDTLGQCFSRHSAPMYHARCTCAVVLPSLTDELMRIFVYIFGTASHISAHPREQHLHLSMYGSTSAAPLRRVVSAPQLHIRNCGCGCAIR